MLGQLHLGAFRWEIFLKKRDHSVRRPTKAGVKEWELYKFLPIFQAKYKLGHLCEKKIEINANFDKMSTRGSFDERLSQNWCMKGSHWWEQNKQWGQWVNVVCKKEANVATHSRHYFSERPRDWHCTGDGTTRMHGLFAGGGVLVLFWVRTRRMPGYHSIATPQKNKICSHTETKCSVYPPGAARWKVGYGYARPWRHSFHALVAFHKTPFQYFTSQNHNSPITIPRNLYLKISAEFSTKASNCSKIQFTWLNFVEKFGQL